MKDDRFRRHQIYVHNELDKVQIEKPKLCFINFMVSSAFLHVSSLNWSLINAWKHLIKDKTTRIEHRRKCKNTEIWIWITIFSIKLTCALIQNEEEDCKSLCNLETNHSMYYVEEKYSCNKILITSWNDLKMCT